MSIDAPELCRVFVVVVSSRGAYLNVAQSLRSCGASDGAVRTGIGRQTRDTSSGSSGFALVVALIALALVVGLTGPSPRSLVLARDNTDSRGAFAVGGIVVVV